MCGIIGYIGNRNVSEFLQKGLRNLEYRGYDSVGVAVLNPNLVVEKEVGTIDKLGNLNFKSHIGIAHTRWATHGKVSKENAHPHIDCSKRIAIVHNGIIENYKDLKEALIKKGHNFTSETDSEVIAHLIEDENEPFENAFVNAVTKLEGSFAVLAIKDGEDKILAARKSSPLVIGLSAHGTFLSSDIPSFLEWTKDVIYLHDQDIAIASMKEIKIYNLVEGWVERKVDTVRWDVEQAKKGEFEYYMLKEITEQAETIQRAIQQDEEIILEVADDIKRAFGTFFVGCGSSYNACLAGSYLFSKIAKTHVNLALASEFENYKHFLTDRTLVLPVSQSGETADILEAVKAAKERDGKVVSIVNVMGSSITRESDLSLLMHAGPEICVLSTKTYTSQVALMALLAYALAGEYEVGKNRLKSLYLDVYNLTSRAMREHLKKLAEILVEKEHIYLIGRELQYATALEGALKIKEVSYIHAEAFAGGELKHGPLALIEDSTPVIVFATEDDKKILSNAEEVKSRGGYIIEVSSERHDIFDYWIKVPEAEELNPIAQIIPMQILAYELAVLRGFDPDKPRNLAKSVTVT